MAQGSPAAAAPQTAGKSAEPERKPSDAAAAKYVFNATTLLQRGDQDGALQQLDSAKAINPEELRLWSGYGYLHLAKGDKAMAATEFEKELALHPEVLEVYATLADLDDQLDRRADEEATLRKLIELEPRSAPAAARLVKMLREDGKAAEAVSTGKQATDKFALALAAEPRLNPRAGDGLAYELSKAYADAGMKKESLATLADLLKVTQSPGILNDGAFRLAEANTELPLAEKSARIAVAQGERNTQRMGLYTEAKLQKLVTDQVVAVWDTLGWVLFREGKLDDAEGYLKSAWLQRRTITVGEHLAEIEAARGDKNLALTVCDLSLATGTKPQEVDAKLTGEAKVSAEADAAETAKTAAEDTAKLKARSEELRRAGAVSKGPAGLTAMLTSPVAPLRGVSGVGEFRVLLAFGTVVSATGISPKNTPGMLTPLTGTKLGLPLWPKGSGARLMMKAVVSCRPAGCSMALSDP